ELQREKGGWGSAETTFEQIRVAASAGTSAEEVKAEIQQLIDADYSNADITVRTSAEQVDYQTQQITGDTNVLLIVVLAFAVVALFVAGLVITNTFQVLIAQRTRQLALLRCVGATRSQGSRSVTIEYLNLGI